MDTSPETSETIGDFTVAIKVERDENRDNLNTEYNHEPIELNSTDAMTNPSTGLSICLHCYQHFQPTDLQYHMITVHKYRNVRFKCQNCTKTFDERSHLYTHKQYCFPPLKKRKRTSFMQMIKDVDKQYKTSGNVCEVVPCPVCFIEIPQYTLRNHVLTEHSADSLFRCDLCNKSFKYKFTLRDHIKLVHLAVDDSVECDVCEQKFKSLKYMNNHKRNVHPAADAVCMCKLCNKQFKTATCLRQHNRYVHPPDAHSSRCYECNKTYKSKMNLQQHMKIVHKEKKT